MAGIRPLSPFVMVMFEGRLFARLCAFNPNNPVASTAFVVLRSEIPSGICAKLRTVAASNNRDHMP